MSRRELTRAAIVTGGALLAAACGGADRREPIRETQTSGGDCETPGGCGGHDGGEEANRDAPPPDPRSPEEIARQRREAEAAMEREREAERRAREAYRREREDEERLRREQLRREQEDDSCCPPYGAPPLVVELV